jgi:ribosomal protein L40E
MSFGFMYKFGGFMIKDNIVNLILKAISRAKAELASSVPVQPAANVKYCVKCGASTPVDAIYCPKCGQKQP